MNNDYSLNETYAVQSSNFNAAGDASAAIKNILKRLGIATTVTRQIAIASYEAELNIIIHSQGGHLHLVVNRDKVTLVAEDVGPGIADLAQAMTEGFSTAPESVRMLGFGAGMGLPNMKRCADEFDIESAPGSGTTIRMKFYIR